MALCLSIGDPSMPDIKIEGGEGQEFSRYTLLGEWDAFFISILRERLIHDHLDPDLDLLAQFKAHLNRGIIMLNSRIKDLSDVCDLLPLLEDARKKVISNVKKDSHTKRFRERK